MQKRRNGHACLLDKIWIATGLFAVALANGHAAAETLHSQNGVIFEGTFRRVVSGAAVCHVLEQNHTPDEHKRLGLVEHGTH